MRTNRFRVLLLASLALAPMLVAGSAGADVAPVAGCPRTYTTVDLSATDNGVYYVGDDGSVWEESNALKGLQCYRMNLGGRIFDADTRVAPL